MDSIKTYIKNFLSRKGGWVFSSMIIGKLFIFFSSWIALKLLPQDDLGYLLFALNIILFFVPISGLGATHGLLRFGSFQETSDSRQNLLREVLIKGFIFSTILMGSIIVMSRFLTIKMPGSQFYLLGLSFLILTLFFLEAIKTYYRIIGKNEIYAKIEITNALILLPAVFITCYFFGIWGYLSTLVLTPMLATLVYFPKNIIQTSTSGNKLLGIDFWKYSVFTGLSNSVTQLLAIADIFLIGYLLKDPAQVTFYKYLSLIPLSLVLLPNAFLMTDFVSLTTHIKNSRYISQYIKQYISLLIIILLGIWTIHFIFIEDILKFLGRDFLPYKKVYLFLLFGVTAVILLRILFGNLLSAFGKARINFWIASFSVVINLLLNLYFIPTQGILGAAITSCLTMWISSLLSMFCVYYFLKKSGK
ncbi:polysaccharide biosynthesis C-terminal domain-containing protein [Namhaeicola litoreus]|uniref:Polysaccharide biosynthesis C-terminal domain-containing protein n=1 Tax=Namhaeicola litoreus TaxID=1052145 RepID=A0ABW3Y5N6_9FLAO